ncbi:MAG: hypothetical protein M9894_20160 [Planctomycetes bacterium]|nr:hypothetical protein [Planctomycetota bacterium]
MSDETLRGLERAARAREDDLEAGWVYARALERAGDRRSTFFELCRLGRAGDARAAVALSRWGEPGAALGAPALPRALDLRRARARAVTDPALAGVAGLLGARGEAVVARAPGAVVVVDIAAGACARLPAERAALRGDDLVHAAEDGGALVLSALDGAALGRVDLPWTLGLLAVGRDRALVSPRDPGPGRHPLVALDLGAAPGRVLWATEAERRAARLLVAGGRGVRVTTGWRVETYDLEAGAVTDHGRLFRTHERRWLQGVDLEVDAAGGALLHRATYREEDDDFGPAAEEAIIGELDLARGDARWRVAGPWSTAGLWCGPTLAITAAREGPAHALVGIERPTGRLRFEAVVGRAQAVVVQDDALLAAGVRPDGRALVLATLDARAGRLLERREVDLPTPLPPEPAPVAVAAALGPGGLRVAAAGDGVVVWVEVPG